MRLPQEDFCQALGIAPNRKYESDGGPDFGSITRLLQQSTQFEQDPNTLLATQILFWMLAAGRFHLSPLYDVHSAWPVIGGGLGKWQVQKGKLAMAAEGQTRHYKMQDIKRRHFNHMAHQHGYPQGAELIIQSFL